MCHQNTGWSEALPLVLLGIRTAWKEDIKASAAELVYGETLRLPGEFFVPDKASPDVTDFVSRLRLHMARPSPEPASRHGKKTFYVPKDLATAEFVFLRQDAARRSLEPPYTGPYKVLERGSKTFKIVVNDRESTVTIDRLKPAYMTRDDNTTPQTRTEQTPTLANSVPENINPTLTEETVPVRKTRSGRTVRFPDHYRPQ
ncbi:uncharacterized protein [Battus philenor]|uniref:uncharacterized protein n=1 Tax=Battus philenor TaxID=42288 RepID=UPI0035D02FED